MGLTEKDPFPEGHIVSTLSEFRDALGHAQLAGKDWLEVSGELFAHLSSRKETPYIVYSGGIKVYPAGMREFHEELEGKTLDDFAVYNRSRGMK